MQCARTTSDRSTWGRRARLGLLGGAVALVASACRSSEVCVRPLADQVADGALSTLPEPPPGQDDAAFVLELSAAATELDYAGVVELEIVARARAEDDSGPRSDEPKRRFPSEYFPGYSDGQGLLIETWVCSRGTSEYVNLHNHRVGASTVEHMRVTEHGLEHLHDRRLVNIWDDGLGLGQPDEVVLRPRRAVRACILFGLDQGSAPTSVSEEIPRVWPTRFLLKEPGASYQLRAVVYSGGEPIVASNWVELTVEDDVSPARREAVLVIEATGLAAQSCAHFGKDWSFPHVGEREEAILIRADSRFQSHLPASMREWVEAVWICSDREYTWRDERNRERIRVWETVEACRELLEEMERWREIPRTLPRRCEALRTRLEWHLELAREESDRQRGVVRDAGAEERASSAAPESVR
jgi:hypothetical protein